MPLEDRRGIRTVFVDLSRVEWIDGVSVLYLVAHVDSYRSRGIWVNGNYPASQAALLALHDAQFERYLGIRPRIFVDPRLALVRDRYPSLTIIKGSTGERISPDQWLPLYQYIETHVGKGRTDTLYQALGEFIENVKQHAYSGAGNWYAVALRPIGTEPARIVVLDLGQGIHNTVLKKVSDRLRELWGSSIALALRLTVDADAKDEDSLFGLAAILYAASDYSRIRLATLGLRTRTGGQERGTGLDSLRRQVLKFEGYTLYVASGSAVVTWPERPTPSSSFLPTLKGTYVCLELGTSEVVERQG